MQDAALSDALARGHWACYAPTDFCPSEAADRQKPANRESIVEDLRAARPFIDSLITYGIDMGLEQIPEAAAYVKPPYRCLIVGIWRPDLLLERQTVIELVRRQVASGSTCRIGGVCAGNEGLWFGRYSLEALAEALRHLRAELPDDVALTTSEPIPDRDDYAVSESLPIDFHLPTIHPFFTSQREHGPERAADYVMQKVKRLTATLQLPCLVKETGWASGGAEDATPEAQLLFWKRLRELIGMQNDALPAWSLFELYDAGDWKKQAQGNDTESSWGWFHNDAGRTPKPVAGLLPHIF